MNYSKQHAIHRHRIIFDSNHGDCQFCGANYGDPYLMHLDQNPRNNRPGNLASGCPGCHASFDAPFRLRKMRERDPGLDGAF